MRIKTFETEEELAKAFGLFKKVFADPPHNEKWDEDILREQLVSIFIDGGKGYCYYVEEEGKVVGFLFARKFAWEQGHKVYIEYTGVDHEYRNRGVATLLYEKLEEETRKTGMKDILLTTHPSSLGYPFWKKHGFKKDPYMHMNKRI